MNPSGKSPNHADFFTPQQEEAQALYGNQDRAKQIVSGYQDPTCMTSEQIEFIESSEFFFLATTDAKQNTQCSFKGGGAGIVRAFDGNTLYYPEFAGNDMMLSVGNILANPWIGILWISFETKRRLRLTGKATIIEHEKCVFGEAWPKARLIVEVQVTRIFPNCSRFVPKFIKGKMV